MLTITLPYPPSVNRYWRSVKGRVLISAEGRTYRDSAAIFAKSVLRGAKPLTVRLSVSIELSPPDRRRRDIDNVLKALLDSLTYSGVWLDDSQIDRLTIERLPVTAGGGVTVCIEPYQTKIA
jgi:crossover junction endodeoxyribonuclease RusA